MKIFYHSNFALSSTGFGRNAKEVLKHLSKKFEVIEFATAISVQDLEQRKIERVPWKVIPSWPPNPFDYGLNPNDPNDQMKLRYGNHGYLDHVLINEKPTHYIGAEDPWAFGNIFERPWFNRINSCLHITVDSIPILDLIKLQASNIKDYFVWAKFAERELNKIGLKNVKRIPAAINFSNFTKLDKKEIRAKHKINENDLIFGFVFRNQLRKLVGKLIEAFSIFSPDYPNAKLLLHTGFHETQHWDIPRLCNQFNVPIQKVLVSYACSQCRDFYISHFAGEGITCKKCQTNTVGTPSINNGISERELNEVYNVMDAYIHPVTSGGFEIPIIEAGSVGMPMATVPYSFGEEFCEQDFIYSLSCDYYQEVNSHFLKANPRVDSILNFMRRVAKYKKEKYLEVCEETRKWINDEYDVNKTLKMWEEWVLGGNKGCIELIERENINTSLEYKDYAEFSNEDFIEKVHKDIFGITINPKDKEGLLNNLNDGFVSKEQLFGHLMGIAHKKNKENELKNIENYLEQNGKNRVLFIAPDGYLESYLSTGAIENMTEKYKGWDCYIACKPTFKRMFDHLPVKYIPYSESFENVFALEGIGDHKGFFDVVLNPSIFIQKNPIWTKNGYA